MGSNPARQAELAANGYAAIARDGWPEQAKRYVEEFANLVGATPTAVT